MSILVDTLPTYRSVSHSWYLETMSLWNMISHDILCIYYLLIAINR